VVLPLIKRHHRYLLVHGFHLILWLLNYSEISEIGLQIPRILLFLTVNVTLLVIDIFNLLIDGRVFGFCLALLDDQILGAFHFVFHDLSLRLFFGGILINGSRRWKRKRMMTIELFILLHFVERVARLLFILV